MLLVTETGLEDTRRAPQVRPKKLIFYFLECIFADFLEISVACFGIPRSGSGAYPPRVQKMFFIFPGHLVFFMLDVSNLSFTNLRYIGVSIGRNIQYEQSLRLSHFFHSFFVSPVFAFSLSGQLLILLIHIRFINKISPSRDFPQIK